MTNLITNAVKYTEPKGKITVRLKSSPEELRISVTDTGTGLTQLEIDRIFEMFHQSRTPHTQNVGGLGVGLTVARSLAELHGGGLLAESLGLGQGATFTLWLPPLKRYCPGRSPFPQCRPTRCAAVDRRLLRGAAHPARGKTPPIPVRRCSGSFCGGECLRDHSGQRRGGTGSGLARNRPKSSSPTWACPGMSGLEFMSQLRARPDFKEVIAIALTGLGREQDIEGASRGGLQCPSAETDRYGAALDLTLVQALQQKMA